MVLLGVVVPVVLFPPRSASNSHSSASGAASAAAAETSSFRMFNASGQAIWAPDSSAEHCNACGVKVRRRKRRRQKKRVEEQVEKERLGGDTHDLFSRMRFSQPSFRSVPLTLSVTHPPPPISLSHLLLMCCSSPSSSASTTVANAAPCTAVNAARTRPVRVGTPVWSECATSASLRSRRRRGRRRMNPQQRRRQLLRANPPLRKSRHPSLLPLPLPQTLRLSNAPRLNSSPTATRPTLPKKKPLRKQPTRLHLRQ